MGDPSPIPVGYTFGPEKLFTIPSGGDGSAVNELIFDHPYTFFIVWCEDASGIAVSSLMGFEVAYNQTMPLVTLQSQNEPGTPWVNTADLPTSGGFSFQLTEAIGAIRLRIVLDTATVDDVTFYVMGVDQSAG